MRLRLYTVLLALDIAALVFAFVAAGALRLGAELEQQTLRSLAIMLPAFLAVAFNNQSYSLRALQEPRAGAWRVAQALGYAVAVAIALLFSFKVSEQFSRAIFAAGTVLALATLVATRLVAGKLIGARYHWRFANRLVIADGLSVTPEPGDRIIFADEVGIRPTTDDPRTLDRIGFLLENCDSVLLACPADRRRDWSRCLKGTAIQVEVHMPELAQLDAVGLRDCDGVKTLIVGASPLSLRDRILKRSLDIAVSVAALILLLPLMIAVAIAIRLESKGPAIFRQERLGQNNRLFHLLKFRSMRADATDHDGARSASREDDRMTRIGRFIRRTSIDELPQLVNVLLGQMSIVGPRPHALGSTAERAMFWEVDQRYFHRHAVRPGVTGLAQIRGFRGATTKRDDLSNRLACDLEYLAGWTIWRDVKIMARTVRVLMHANAY